MKPPRFEYATPQKTDEVLVLLAQYWRRAKVRAGGQSLMPLLTFRLALADLHRLG